jgi:hypothetical protein
MSLRQIWRSPVGRAITVVAAMLLAAGALSPAFGAQGVTKQQVTKIAKKQVKKVGDPRFIQETELVRYGPITLNAPGTAPVGTFGPFTLTAECALIDDAGDGPPLEEHGLILIDTSEDNSSFESQDDSEDDFDAADPAEEWAEEIADGPDVQDINSEDDDDAHASAPSGTRIAAAANVIILNQAGFDCIFSGAILVLR